MLGHHSNEFWDNFLGIAVHFQTSEWNCPDEHIFYALLKILIWEEAGRSADKTYLLRTADRQLKYAAQVIEKSCSVRRDSLIRLHERLHLIIDDVLRKYLDEASLYKIELPFELKTQLGKTLLKARDELASPPWKDLLINVKSCDRKVVMGLNIEENSILVDPDGKADEKMATTKKKTFGDKIDELWSNFIWDMWYPFTDRFLGVSKSFELREYEFEAAQKYLEIYVARLIHYLVDVLVSESERSLPGLRRCIELANKHLARIRYKPERVQEELFDDNGLMIDRGIQRCMELYRPLSFRKFDLGEHSAIVRRILYYNDNLEEMKWSDLHLKVTIKNGVVVITLDEDDLGLVYWHEREFNEYVYKKQEKT